ncbi:rhamnulokinase family protein [Paenibacillus sp. S150]|uniref:rhamnulokinase n=1 Tax=Paenibacillus sp. S150 TaxID=2749826 RepID=UPI001C593CA3|nr:rhamnulokinase family protein [Paenibacillus sp. S150]MBW4082652.1 rhamnulokinase [Paenibacillus sp. S150]
MTKLKRLLAVDLGASSGRVMLGTYDGSSILTEEIHRFANTPIEDGGHLYWNFPVLLQEIKHGIRLAGRAHGEIASLSVDTWGVDYGFLDHDGRLLGSPHHYRDRRMNVYRSQLEELLPPEEQFRLTGNQPDPINTVYQLYADLQENPLLREHACHILMMPDLFLYLLSGAASAERTILSTSGLLDAGTGEPSSEVFGRLGIPLGLIPPRVEAGTAVGSLHPELCAELGCGPVSVIAGASHDTAAAVASIPYEDREGTAFISCGTWSLVGMETKVPVLTPPCYEYGFTNESCYGSGNRLLKNITGLWLLQETRRAWAEAGEELSFPEMAVLAGNEGAAQSFIQPNDPIFSTPGDMPGRIAEYCRSTGQPVPASKGAIVRTILDSLAKSYAAALGELEEITGKPIRRVHMVGGGIQNKLLCQLTADASAKEIIAGPVEASALGNLLVQLAALGELDFSRAAEIVAASETLTVYRPNK